MLAFRVSRLLRAAGYALLLCLGFLAAETVVADACDGNGRAARAVSQVESAGARALGHGAHAVDLPDAGSDSSGPDTEGRAPGEHSTHVDHCSHPHAGGVIASALASPVPPPLPASVAAESDREPPSASFEPVVRPPVA